MLSAGRRRAGRRSGLAAGCAGTQLENNVREVRTIAKEARDNGAYKCAPRELALAETHVEFAEHELDQGDYFRARDHLHIADHNAREAYACRRATVRGPRRRGDRDGDGILDNVDKCPDDPEDKDGFEDEDGCPDPDNDKDGILDTKDKCPNEPEDKDGFEDEDGCPDPDNDTDGIPDEDDKCPNEPEDKDGFEDEDGCPDPDNDKDGVPDAADKCPNDPGPPDNDGCPKKYEHIVVTQEKIELKQKIFFDTDKATIQPRSFSLLDEIAAVLEIAADHDGAHRGPHRLARDAASTTWSSRRPERSPCGNIWWGWGSNRRGWKRRVTVPISRSRPTRRLRGGKRIGAWNSSSRSNNEAEAKDDPFAARTTSFAIALAMTVFAAAGSRPGPGGDREARSDEQEGARRLRHARVGVGQEDPAGRAGRREEGGPRQPPGHGPDVRPPGRRLHHGLQEPRKALQSFNRALEIDPGIQLSKGIATTEVNEAFAAAKRERGGGGGGRRRRRRARSARVR